MHELSIALGILDLAELVIDDLPLVIHCPACAAERTPVSPFELRCPDCGTPSNDIVHRRRV